MVKVLILLFTLTCISCGAPSKYNVCLQFWSRGRLIKICDIDKRYCNILMERYRERKGKFPRHPEEGCFYDRKK
jgi:hypothetical protein